MARRVLGRGPRLEGRRLKRRLEDHVVGLGDADEDLVGLHGLDVHAVLGDDGELPQVADVEVEVGRGGGVDDPEADALAGVERPEGGALLAVDEEGVVAHVAQVHGPHPGPLVSDEAPQVPLGDGVGDGGQEALLPGVDVAVLLEVREDRLGPLVRPVAHDHREVVLDVRLRPRPLVLDDDGAVEPALLLEVGVGVVPVGPGVADGEPEGVGAAGLDDPRVGELGPVLLPGDQDPVPVERGRHVQLVGDVDHGHVAEPEAQGGRRDGAVDGQGVVRVHPRHVLDHPLHPEVVAPLRARRPEGEGGEGYGDGRSPRHASPPCPSAPHATASRRGRQGGGRPPGLP